ncbi:MAG: hypothetical protein LAT56_12845 [Wenzhouxiangella sp.]|nr:hypothetical protein [Wenzhouxiangella sp.]
MSLMAECLAACDVARPITADRSSSTAAIRRSSSGEPPSVRAAVFFLPRFFFEAFFLLAFLRVAFLVPGTAVNFFDAFFLPAFFLDAFFLVAFFFVAFFLAVFLVVFFLALLVPGGRPRRFGAGSATADEASSGACWSCRVVSCDWMVGAC